MLNRITRPDPECSGSSLSARREGEEGELINANDILIFILFPNYSIFYLSPPEILSTIPEVSCILRLHKSCNRDRAEYKPPASCCIYAATQWFPCF